MSSDPLIFRDTFSNFSTSAAIYPHNKPSYFDTDCRRDDNLRKLANEHPEFAF